MSSWTVYHVNDKPTQPVKVGSLIEISDQPLTVVVDGVPADSASEVVSHPEERVIEAHFLEQGRTHRLWETKPGQALMGALVEGPLPQPAGVWIAEPGGKAAPPGK